MNTQEILEAAKMRREELMAQIAPSLEEIKQLDIVLGTGARHRREWGNGSIGHWAKRAVMAHPAGVRAADAKRWIIEQGGNSGFSPTTIGVELSRMAASGIIARLSKGLYGIANGGE